MIAYCIVCTTKTVITNHYSFLNYFEQKGRTEAGPSICNKSARDSTVVDSSETPVPGSRVSHAAAQVSAGNAGYGAAASGGAAAVAVASSAAGEETGPFELTVTSSPGGSGASVSASAELVHKPAAAAEDRKRKGIEVDEAECQSEVSVLVGDSCGGYFKSNHSSR